MELSRREKTRLRLVQVSQLRCVVFPLPDNADRDGRAIDSARKYEQLGVPPERSNAKSKDNSAHYLRAESMVMLDAVKVVVDLRSCAELRISR
jgi:hypothetical protein